MVVPLVREIDKLLVTGKLRALLRFPQYFTKAILAGAKAVAFSTEGEVLFMIVLIILISMLLIQDICQQSVPVFLELDFIEALEDRIDIEDAMRALKDIKKNGSVSWNKVKSDLGI